MSGNGVWASTSQRKGSEVWSAMIIDSETAQPALWSNVSQTSNSLANNGYS